MRIEVDIDGETVEKAARLTGIADAAALVAAGLQLLVTQESARVLARLGGSEKELRGIRRRRGN